MVKPDLGRTNYPLLLINLAKEQMRLTSVFYAAIKIVFFAVPLAAFASDWTPFAITGEQLNHLPPKGWRLAWMDGKPDGRYLVEYIPERESINS